MAKFFFTISDENEERLRQLNRRKGDMSKVINYAVNEVFKKYSNEQILKIIKEE